MKDKLKDKMKKKFTDLSISHKMLMVYITFASAFLLIALGLTQISFRIYSKELYDKSLQELDYFSQNVNRGLKDAERNNYSISMDALVQRTLSDLSVLEYPSLDYNQKIRDLRRILLNEYDPESCVKSIIFVDLYGNTVEVGTAAWDVSGESFTAIKKQMEQGKGAYTTYGPTEECPYLLSGRVVRNRLDMSLSDMGKLIFVCDVGNVISENKESLSSNKAAIYVYNKNCAIYEDENIKKLDDLPKYVEHSGYKILKQSGRKYFVSYLYSAKTDWTYVSFFPYSDIYGQVQTVRTLLILGFLAVFLLFIGREYKRLGWVMQLHYGVKRDNNSKMFKSFGANAGCDCIDSYTPSAQLADLLNGLQEADALPKTILYSLNPIDNAAIGSVMGCFQHGPEAGYIQQGSAWWFNDNKTGITEQLTSLANQGLLGCFVGMLTDSRSFVSYTRHEYFRRILCNLIGNLVENGEYPYDESTLGKLVEDISYNNTKNYFHFA